MREHGISDPNQAAYLGEYGNDKGVSVWKWYKGMALMGAATDSDGNPNIDVDPSTVVEAAEAIANQTVVFDERRDHA